jgi:HAD superfamily hydrolase (TIGR01458 family)
VDIRGLLLDIDGVLTTSWRALDGAVETVEALRSADVPLLLLTNTTVKTRRQLGSTLRDAGFEVRDEEILTATVGTGAYLRTHHSGQSCYLIAKTDVSEDLEGVQLVDDDADVVVISGAEEGFTYERLNNAFNMIAGGAAFVTMHKNLYWRTDEGMRLDAGAFVAGLERATGKEATVVGKPSEAFFGAALELLGVERSAAAMVGDDIENDVLAAQRAGLTGIQVRTGKFGEDDLERAAGKPDHVIDSIADLPELLGL